MTLELGRWFMLHFVGGGMFLKAPVVGEVWIGPGGWRWDR